MKVLYFNIVCFLSFGAILSSCDEQLVVDSNELPKLVLNGLLTIDDTIKVELSKTRDLFNEFDGIDWVRNADVYLTADNSVAELLVYKGNGVYSSTSKIAENGGVYSIEVNHAVYNNIKATAEMPEPTIGEVNFTGTDSNGNKNFELNIVNNNNAENYFIWEMIERQNGVERNIEIISFDSKTDNILPDETQNQEKIFLQGSDLIQIDDVTSGFSTSGIEEDEFTNIEIHLNTVNEDMYKYYRSLELYRNSSKKFINPVEIYSNVENGLGIFGAVSYNVIPVTF